jgi:hypothetical protein
MTQTDPALSSLSYNTAVTIGLDFHSLLSNLGL